MDIIQIIFWILLFIIFYAYVGYGILLFILVKMKQIFSSKKQFPANSDFEPEVTLFIAAYNEKDFVDAKVKNSRELEYPAGKLHQVWV
ncbi:MAG: glycosyltransferase family 2 protein, partial [Prolixibacteraceae bacterium]|nr:glycosyltransferase family 2 protein [Prolixibacteraceae bacterium]